MTEEQRLTEELEERYRAVRERIEAACGRAGRDPAEVRVIGVTKTKPAAVVRAAARAGMADFGENYVQEYLEKRADVSQDVRWHFIGHLQRNKVKYLVPGVSVIHGVDSERLAVEIDRQAARTGERMPVLVQVNTSGEESKFGCDPSAAPALLERVAGLEYLDVQGFMTLAAFLDDPEALRPMFRLLRRLRDDLRDRTGLPLPHLSMGMTNDFEVAVEEGATLVRIGTALFGERGIAD